MERQELRDCIAAVEQQVTLVEEKGRPTSDADRDALRASWARLVAHLAVGPAPATRACPTCQRLIMRDATRCMHCWTKSPAEK